MRNSWIIHGNSCFSFPHEFFINSMICLGFFMVTTWLWRFAISETRLLKQIIVDTKARGEAVWINVRWWRNAIVGADESPCGRKAAGGFIVSRFFLSFTGNSLWDIACSFTSAACSAGWSTRWGWWRRRRAGRWQGQEDSLRTGQREVSQAGIISAATLQNSTLHLFFMG